MDPEQIDCSTYFIVHLTRNIQEVWSVQWSQRMLDIHLILFPSQLQEGKNRNCGDFIFVYVVALKLSSPQVSTLETAGNVNDKTRKLLLMFCLNADSLPLFEKADNF